MGSGSYKGLKILKPHIYHVEKFDVSVKTYTYGISIDVLDKFSSNKTSA